MARNYSGVVLSLVLIVTVIARSALAETTVPTGLEGMARLEAIVSLQAAGFRVTLEDESSCAAPGTVSSVTPAGGSVVDADPPRVTLGISKGGVDEASAVAVPELEGMAYAEAEAKLSGLGLQAVDEKYSVDGGSCFVQILGLSSVKGTRPNAGALVCPGTQVAVRRQWLERVGNPKEGEACP